MSLNEQDRREIDERIARQLDARSIVDIFTTMSGEEKEQLADSMAQSLWDMQRSRALPDSKQFVNTRYLNNGLEVTTDADANPIGFTGGKSQFDIVNFLSGSEFAVPLVPDGETDGGISNPETVSTYVMTSGTNGQGVAYTAPASMILVAVHTMKNSQVDTSATAVTIDGVACTFLGKTSSFDGTRQVYAELWYLLNPGTPYFPTARVVSATVQNSPVRTQLGTQIVYGATDVPTYIASSGTMTGGEPTTLSPGTSAGTFGTMCTTWSLYHDGGTPTPASFAPTEIDSPWGVIGGGWELTPNTWYKTDQTDHLPVVTNTTPLTSVVSGGTPTVGAWVFQGALLGASTSTSRVDLWIDSKSNARQLNIDLSRLQSGGADCMFDYIVSACWAAEVTAGRGTEGQTFTSLSGCTFKIYSTVAAMVTQAFTDFGTNPATAFICPDTYSESNITFGLSQKMLWFGGGRENTIIGNTGATGTPTINSDVGNTLVLKSLHIQGPSNAAGVETGSGDEAGRLYADDCKFTGGSTTNGSSTAGIHGASQSRTYLTNCHLIKNGYYTTAGFIHAVNCTHTGGGTGIYAFSDSQVEGCEFYSSAVGLHITQEGVNAVGNRFFVCTVGIEGGSAMRRSALTGNMLNACTIGIDLQGHTGTGAIGNQIIANEFAEGVTACIRMPVAANRFVGGIVAQNTSDGAAAFITGTVPAHYRIGPNYENSGYSRTDVLNSTGLWGLVGGAAEFLGGINSGYDIVRWGPFVVYFGSTRVAVAAGSYTYAAGAAGTYYVSVNSSGTVTANTSGAFPAGGFPMAAVTVDANGVVTAITHDDTVFRTTATGYAPASSNEPFVTHAASGNLSDERVATAGSGISITNAGTNGGALTWALAPLTADWTQSGAFDINSSGKLKGTSVAASGLTGATAASRYVGATASGAPVSGTFAVGDYVIDQTGKIYVCTVAGTPGTWVDIAGAGGAHAFVGASHTGDDDYTMTPNVLGLGVSTGDIKVYSNAGITLVGEWDGALGHIGIGGPSDAAIGIYNPETFTNPAASAYGANISPTFRHTGAVTRSHYGTYIVPAVTIAAAGTLSGTQRALLTGVTADDESLGGTVSAVTAWSPLITTLGTVIVTTARGIHLADPTVAGGSIGTFYGIDIPALAAATLNIGIRNLATMRQVGVLTVGSDAAANSMAVADFVSTDKGLLIPRLATASRPAGVNGLIYYDSTTNKFVAYENGAYTNMIGGGSGSVATDAIWDAAGDLAVGTGANTAAVLSKPSPTEVANTTPSSFTNWASQAGNARKTLMFDSATGTMEWDYLTAIDVLTPAQVLTFNVSGDGTGDDTLDSSDQKLWGRDAGTWDFTMTYQGTASAATIDSTRDDATDYPVTVLTPFTSYNNSAAITSPVAVNSTITFTLTATVDGQSKQKTVVVTYRNRKHWGVNTDTDLTTSAEVNGLSTEELMNAKGRSFTVSPSSQYIWYCYPSRLGTVTFTIDAFPAAFDLIRTLSHTNDGGETEDYYCYRSTNLLTGTNLAVVAT